MIEGVEKTMNVQSSRLMVSESSAGPNDAAVVFLGWTCFHCGSAATTGLLGWVFLNSNAYGE